VAGITPAGLAAVGGRLEAFAAEVFESLPRKDQRARGECYLRGLMLDGRRKSVEPMAARLGEVHYQALHHFVAVSPWDWRPVRRRLAERLVGALGPMVWAVDDTGFPKDGPCSVGVQRQYSGTLGKTGNCQLGVSVNAVTEQASCPLDWRLFVPESWDDDTPATMARRAACHLPNDVHHRPKWQLALDMLDELAGWDLRPPVLVADCGYGEIGQFRGGLDDRQISYVVQVKADTSAYPEQVHPVAAPYKGTGRRPRPRYHDQPCSLEELALAAGQSACVDLVWRRGSKGLQRSRFAALRVRPAGVTPRRQAARAGLEELPLRWLLVEWPHGEPEPVKYWLSNPRHHAAGGAGPVGQAALAYRAGLPRAQRRAGPGPLRRPQLAGLAPPRDPGLGRPRLSHPGAAWPPETGGVGLSLWQLLEQLQVLLACWAGACPLCRRPAPRWLSRRGRSPAPT
jgi:SRSO17 transposase